MRPDPSTMPVVRVVFTLADGTVLQRDWTMHEPPPRVLMEGPPEWLGNARRTWDHPQDPVTLTGDVDAGHEAEARELLA